MSRCFVMILWVLGSMSVVFADSCCQVNAETNTAYTSESLFHLKSSWTNQSHEVVGVDSLRGHAHVVAMFFSNCSTICPRLVNDIQQMEQALSPDIREHFRVVLISLDPVRDTPESLVSFQKKMNLDPVRWQLWQGHPKDVREMAAALGVSYRSLPGGDVAHSAPIILLNGQGEIDMRVDGLSDPREAMIERIKVVTQ